MCSCGWPCRLPGCKPRPVVRLATPSGQSSPGPKYMRMVITPAATISPRVIQLLMVCAIANLSVLLGGELEWDRAHELELGVVVVDDYRVARHPNDLTGQVENARTAIPIEAVQVVDRRNNPFFLVVSGHMAFAVEEV